MLTHTSMATMRNFEAINKPNKLNVVGKFNSGNRTQKFVIEL
jgi:hypothetical protein